MQVEAVARSRTKRLSYITLFFVLLTIVLLGQLINRQLLRRGYYTAQAEKQYYLDIKQTAPRGTIYIKDDDTQNLIDETKSGLFPVASDLEMFDVLVTPLQIADDAGKHNVANQLAPILGMNADEIYSKINNNLGYVPPIAKKIDKETADKVTALNLKGVSLESNYSRIYPENDFLSQTLGFVDSTGNGRYGVEEYYDGLLKGQGGELKGLKDATGKIIQSQQSEPGKDGSSIVLTIDRSIQYEIEQKLKDSIKQFGAEGGSIIVMDPKTGAILGMASQPDYDPNNYNEVAKDNQSLFLNPAVSMNFEPGSVFKPVICAAAINENKLQPDSKPDQPFGSYVTVNGYQIHNALDKPYGYETVTQILENSDNVGMVWVGNALGNQTMSDYIKKFGFGSKTGVDLPGEAQGQVLPVRQWQDVSRATMTFGQGISVTPLQMIDSYATLANQGQFVEPRIMDQIINPDGTRQTIQPSAPQTVVSKDTAQKVTDMLVSVVDNGLGKKAHVDGFKVAGKTGTAQMPDQNGKYSSTDTIGSFIGYAPANDPKFVMEVKFVKPRNVNWAESSAAPVFGEIADWLLNSYYKLPKS